MKFEAAHAFVALLVTTGEGSGSLWSRIPILYRAIAVLGIVFMAGSVAGSTWNEQRAIPSKVAAFENRMDSIEDRLDDREDLVDARFSGLDLRFLDVAIQLTNIELIGRRSICRQDGNTANFCDLKYGGGKQIIP